MYMRLILTTLAFVAIPTIAAAQDRCSANFLSGNAKYVIDAASGNPMVMLPYAATGYAGNGYTNYTVDLGGGTYGGGYGKPVDPPVIPPPPPPPPPVEPGFTDDLALAPNDIGATRLIFPGDGTGQLTGPNTNFTFTGIDPTGLFVDGDLIARGGSGLIARSPTTAVPDASGAVLRVGSGFNPTGTRAVRATFANGAILDTTVLRPGQPEPPMPPTPPSGFSGDLMLEPNAVNATRLSFPGDGTAILIGTGTSVIFAGVDASGLAQDAPVIARSGSGTVNGLAALAVPLFDDNGPVVLTLSAGFNPTGTQAVNARFSTGAELQTNVIRQN